MGPCGARARPGTPASEANRPGIAAPQRARPARVEQEPRGQTDLLVRTLNALAADPELDKFVGHVLQVTLEQLGDDAASLWLYDRARDSAAFFMEYDPGRLPPASEKNQLKREYRGEEIFEWKEFTRFTQPHVFYNPNDIPALACAGDWFHERGIQTTLVVPLVVSNESLGWFVLFSHKRHSYQPEDLELAQAFAKQISLAIQMTRLAEKARHSAVLQERNRMAREIHDTLAQGFTGILVQLSVAEEELARRAEDAQPYIVRARNLARESLDEARRSVMALRPHALTEGDLPSALERLAAELSANTRVRVKFLQHGAPHPLPPEIEDGLLRIAQEALTNTLKHARAHDASIDLSFQPDQVRLVVCDDGRGFATADRPPESSFGLLNMRERAEQLRGGLRVHSQSGQGTRIEVHIPNRARASRA